MLRDFTRLPMPTPSGLGFVHLFCYFPSSAEELWSQHV